jgi:thymidylate synthase (FAD)
MSARLIAHSQLHADIGGTMEDLVAYCARVSNPTSQAAGQNVRRLLDYMIEHAHWSPFEMASVVVEVEATRDIARQLLRHRSFTFQEFSQRYAEAPSDFVEGEVRMKHPTNRQSSLKTAPKDVEEFWAVAQGVTAKLIREYYESAITKGIAPEVARKILPEGMTRSRLYVHGTIRSWMHYVDVRTRPDTQLEHRELARDCAKAIELVFPMIMQFVHEEAE